MLGGAREWNLVKLVGVSGMRSLWLMSLSSMLAARATPQSAPGPSHPTAYENAPMSVMRSSASHSSNSGGTSLIPSAPVTVATIAGAPGARGAGAEDSARASAPAEMTVAGGGARGSVAAGDSAVGCVDGPGTAWAFVGSSSIGRRAEWAHKVEL